MKKYYILLTFMILGVVTYGQTVHTITIQSNTTNSTWAYIASNGTGCGTTNNSMVLETWTSGGTHINVRALLEFDLSAIPAVATIDSAFLSLYAQPASTDGSVGSPTFGSDNASGIYRITEAWSTVHWAGLRSQHLLTQMEILLTKAHLIQKTI